MVTTLAGFAFSASSAALAAASSALAFSASARSLAAYSSAALRSARSFNSLSKTTGSPVSSVARSAVIAVPCSFSNLSNCRLHRPIRSLATCTATRSFSRIELNDLQPLIAASMSARNLARMRSEASIPQRAPLIMLAKINAFRSSACRVMVRRAVEISVFRARRFAFSRAMSPSSNALSSAALSASSADLSRLMSSAAWSKSSSVRSSRLNSFRRVRIAVANSSKLDFTISPRASIVSTGSMVGSVVVVLITEKVFVGSCW